MIVLEQAGSNPTTKDETTKEQEASSSSGATTPFETDSFGEEMAPPAYERLPSSPVTASHESRPMTPIHNSISANDLDCTPPLPRRRKRFARAIVFVTVFVVVISFLFRHRVKRVIGRQLQSGQPTRPDPVRDGHVDFERDCTPAWNITTTPDYLDNKQMEALLSQQDWPAHGHPADEQHHITEMPYRPYPPPHRPEAPLLYKARYNLPADLDSIYFLNRGAGAMGSVRYELAPKDSENITIYVDMHYWSKAALGQVNMCVLHRGESHKGFGIFTPSSISWPLFRGDRRAIKFDVVVRIPQSALISPLNGLASDLHDFSQFADGLKHYWNNVNLTSTNGAIVVKSEARLQAANLTLHTTNARIEGSFFSDHVLKMTTTNAPIVAEVGLSSQGYPTTTANIRTNNARINASFYLSGAYNDDETYPGSGGNFNINAWSWGGPIDLAIPIAPINYHLRLFSHTNNAANKARIFRTFEGLFRASTRNAQVKVSKEVTAGDDPQREERHPTLEISDRRKGFSHGKFFWGETYHSRASEFELMTDNGPVEITFI